MRRSLGRSGIEVSALGMGCWAIGGPFWEGSDALGWGGVDDQESIKAIHRALDLGVNFFDTADVYGAGHSERVLAQALRGQRQNVVIATKFGITFDEASRQVTGNDASPEYIVRACDASLKRLKTDYIDLYQFHLNRHDTEEAAAAVGALEKLVEQGKIRCYGWSTDFVDRAEVFEKGTHCTAIQHQQNVLDDNVEMISFCESKNLASINRGPLAMGLLSGKYDLQARFADDDVRGSHSPAWMQYFREGKVNQDLLAKVDGLRKVLTADGRSLVQGALGWLWARSRNTIPIPGFKNVEQVEENCKAMDFGPLPEGQFRSIEWLLDRE